MYSLSRIDVLKVIKKEFANMPIVIPLAATAREMYSLGPYPNEFYVLGSMGMPISISTGIAQGIRLKKKNEKVICIEGDGSLLMNLSSLLTIRYLDLNNLVLFILDNEGYSVTGNQTAQSKKINLSVVANSLGFKIFEVISETGLIETINKIKKSNPESCFVHVKINNQFEKVPLIYTDPIILKSNFMSFMMSKLEK